LGIFLIKKNPVESETLLRQSLATHTKVNGLSHWRTLMAEESLSRVLLENGKYEEGRAMLESNVKKKEKYLPNSPDTALTYNEYSLMLRKEGNATEAEKYLRLALQIDKQFRGENSDKIPHRLMNLCISLVMQSKLAEAKENITYALKLKRDRHDITSARILFISLVITMLESNSEEVIIKKLKSIFSIGKLKANAGVAVKWDIGYFYKFLQTKLTPDKYEFLAELINVLNDQSKAPDLNLFPAWLEANPEPID
jgi:tetratricopeptide (TPR) repeat protein